MLKLFGKACDCLLGKGRGRKVGILYQTGVEEEEEEEEERALLHATRLLQAVFIAPSLSHIRIFHLHF